MSFEDICLRFLPAGEETALLEFLNLKKIQAKHEAGGPGEVCALVTIADSSIAGSFDSDSLVVVSFAEATRSPSFQKVYHTAQNMLVRIHLVS